MISPGREDDVRLVRALLDEPGRAPLWSNLGNARSRRGDHPAAQLAHDRAVRIVEDDAAIWRNRAAAAGAAGRVAESLSSLARAASSDGDALVWLQLAISAHGRGFQDMARVLARCALIQAPEAVEAYRLLVLLENGQRLDSLTRSHRIEPDDVEILRAAGTLMMSRDKADHAVAIFRRAAVLMPEHPRAIELVGGAEAHLGLGRAARRHLHGASRFRPASEFALRTALALSAIPADLAEIAADRARLAQTLDRLETGSVPMPASITLPFYLAYHGEDDRPMMERLAAVYRKALPDLARPVEPLGRPSDAARAGRPRVGLVSRFFSLHTVMFYFAGLITHLARTGAEVTLFALGDVEDEMTARLRSDGATIRRVPDDPTAVRHAIVESRPDVMLFTDIGMEPVSYALALGRLAPLQVLLLGHPVTSGMDSFDLVISSAALEPPDARAHYTEPLAPISGAPGWFDEVAIPCGPMPSRDALGLPAVGRLYVCAQSLFKLHPDFDEVLLRMLDADSTGRVLLFRLPSDLATDQLQARLTRRLGRAADRVILHPRVHRQRFWDIMTAADVVFDSVHFSGGQTSVMALARGLTIATWPGQYMRGRQTAGLYRLLGVDDSIAPRFDALPGLAVALARNPDRRRDMQRRILERRSAVFEDRRFVEEAAGAIRCALDER
jgi:predicted O-linked N-acetylglucosamine transferase (SPINDLY family)